MSIGSSFLKSKRLIAILIVILASLILLLQFFFKPEEPPSSFLLKNTHSENIRDEYRQAVVLKNGTSLHHSVNVGSNSALRVGVGIPKEDWEKANRSYTVVIDVHSSNKTQQFKIDLAPATQKTDRRWKDYEFSLMDFRNRKADINVQLESSAPDRKVFISQMKLLNRDDEAQKPNVLLITIDTLRKDHLSLYAYSENVSPFLDAFGRKAAVFTKAISPAPLTVPSITSLMTSTYYSEHGVRDNRSVFDQSFITLAEVFRNNKYSTAAFVGNAVLRKNRNLDKGFDVYNCFLPGSEINRRLPERNAEQLTTAALTWLKAHKDERWFMWLHYQDPHAPYTPPKPYVDKYKENAAPKMLPAVDDFTGLGGIPDYAKLPGIFDFHEYVARYDGEIAFVDKEIGRFINELEIAKLMDRTTIAITSDHGESFGENDHYFAHGHNVTPELIDIPMIVRGKNINPQMIHHRVSLMDLPVTLLKLNDIHPPKAFRGKDLFESNEERVLISEQPDKRWAAFKGNNEVVYEWSGVFNGSSKWNDGKKFLDQWIQQHVSGGLLFQFSNFNGTATLKSNARVKRMYLFGGEDQDRISMNGHDVLVTLNASGNDSDWLFMEPSPDAEVTLTGVNAIDPNGKSVNSPFRMESIPEQKGSGAAHSGVTVSRIARRTGGVTLSPEQSEELKSLGYVSD
ncbi:MAG TPA: sulfatase [Acidobacteriota bacterium]|nr:sulfatase [Acidobacteriota bacterium]